MRAVLVHELCQFHIEATILRDLDKFAFFEPLDRLQTFRRFFHFKRRRRDGVEREPMTKFFGQNHEHVERRQLREIEGGVTVQHFVVKTQIVETDDQIRALQFRDQIADGFFVENFVFAARRAVSHADAHAHFGNVVPAADFISGFLRFQIEIDDVFGHNRSDRFNRIWRIGKIILSFCPKNFPL